MTGIPQANPRSVGHPRLTSGGISPVLAPKARPCEWQAESTTPLSSVLEAEDSAVMASGSEARRPEASDYQGESALLSALLVPPPVDMLSAVPA